MSKKKPEPKLTTHTCRECKETFTLRPGEFWALCASCMFPGL